MIILTVLSACRDYAAIDAPAASGAIAYDSLRAANLEADDYGMSQYVIALLYKGPNQDIDPVTAADYDRTHMSNIKRLAAEGKLILAGPFMDDGDLKGIYILNVKTIAEAEKLTNTDPSIQAGILRMELHPWYGSAALKEINNVHSLIAKTKM